MPILVRDTSVSPQRKFNKNSLPSESTAPNLYSFEGRLDRLELSVQDFDLIIGTSENIFNGEADITIADLQTQLNADSIADSSRILVKDGTFTFTGNVDVKAEKIKWYRESQNAILDMASFTFTITIPFSYLLKFYWHTARSYLFIPGLIFKPFGQADSYYFF